MILKYVASESGFQDANAIHWDGEFKLRGNLENKKVWIKILLVLFEVPAGIQKMSEGSIPEMGKSSHISCSSGS